MLFPFDLLIPLQPLEGEDCGVDPKERALAQTDNRIAACEAMRSTQREEVSAP